jgi:DNA-binding transcriptional MocR family regulator
MASAESAHLYQQVAAQVSALIDRGALRSGDRLPSVRELARERGVSVATVLAAYRKLELDERVEVRPKSGHFVRPRLVPLAPPPRPARVALAPARVSVSNAVTAMVRSMRDPEVVPLGSASLAPELYPIRALNLTLAAIARETGTAGASAEPPPGILTLRRQLARRSLTWGLSLHEDELVITVGAMEAMHLALRATTRPGDAVAVSSPTYFGVLQLIEEMGLRVVEIPNHADAGLDFEALEQALRRAPIRACVVIPTCDNPLGTIMSDEARARLYWSLDRRDVPLIEDDIHGDLVWDGSRPRAIKALDRGGRVLLCGSISKTLAAGYRIGWIAAGRYQERVERLKYAQTVATSTLEQMAVAEYLAGGRYDRHLRVLRAKLAVQVKAYREAVARWFPEGTRVSDPRGGYLLWVELPRGVAALELQAEALRHRIAIAPGPIFSARHRFGHCIRLNCGSAWSRRTEAAVRTLGELACAMIAPGRRRKLRAA